MENENVSLFNTDPAFLDLQRRQQLAQALAQQADKPDQIFQGPMGQSAIPSYAPISHGLRSFLAAALQKKVNVDAAKTQQEQRQQAADAIQKMYSPGGQTLGGGTLGIPSQTITAQAPNIPGDGPKLPDAMLQTPATTQAGASMQTAPQGPTPAELARLMTDPNPYLQNVAGPMFANSLSQQNMQQQSDLQFQNDVRRNALPMSAAAQQEMDARAKQAREQADYVNKLPETAHEKAEDAARSAEINKPQFVPYGTSGFLQGGKYNALPAGANGTPANAGIGDPKSPSVLGQLGMSNAAYNVLIGNTQAVAKGKPMQQASDEVDQVIRNRGFDPAIVKPKVQAFSDAVKMNTLKSNTLDTLTNELQGTIQNLSPIADKLSGSNVRWVNGAAEFVGGLANDPNAQQYSYYLTQLRSELAGANAVAGGKIGLHGQVETNESHFAEAEKVIKDGLSSGGAAGLARAIEASRAKNVRIVDQQTEGATRGIWNALGLGKNYDATHPAAPGGAGGAGAGGAGAGGRGGNVPPPPPGFVEHP